MRAESTAKITAASGCPARRIETPFQGIVMPLNNEDLQYADSGTYTVNAQKVYTNGSHPPRGGAVPGRI